MRSHRPSRSLEGAAAFVEDVGIAVIFPKDDLVLPSLWEAVAGTRELDWAIRDENGKFVSFTRPMERVWRWKDELPARRLACSGKHLARVVSLVAPRLIGPLYALTGRSGEVDDFRAAELSSLQLEIAEAVLENGACAAPELRTLLGTTDKKGVDRAVEALQRAAVLTNVGVIEQEQGWPAIRVDLFARHWRSRVRRRPAAEGARSGLADAVLSAAREVSAADLAAALGWRRRDAETTLQALEARGRAAAHDEAGITLWSRPHEQ